MIPVCVCPCLFLSCFCTTYSHPCHARHVAPFSNFFARLVSSKRPCPALYSKGHRICPLQASSTRHHPSWHSNPAHSQLLLPILPHLWLLVTPLLPCGISTLFVTALLFLTAFNHPLLSLCSSGSQTTAYQSSCHQGSSPTSPTAHTNDQSVFTGCHEGSLTSSSYCLLNLPVS